MKVLLVTSWNTPSGCGIEAHSRALIEAVHHADPSIQIDPSLLLDPKTLSPVAYKGGILHLNYHRALHSQWVREEIADWKAFGCKVVITFHDTYGELPADDLSRDLCALADAFIVHEPSPHLPKAIYWRMGVPPPTGRIEFGCFRYVKAITGNGARGTSFLDWPGQPVLGSLGFPSGWKNYEKLVDITAELGWALLLIAPTASESQITAWRAVNPALYVEPTFVEQSHATALLSGCDATAFCYTCGNSGQSGAILQGIAARRPVIALRTCRQFRSLYLDPLGREAIRWVETFDEVKWTLRNLRMGRVDPGVVALATQDSWDKLGAKYADLYRDLTR